MYYIYHYIDPRNNLPFYVGKGSGNRLFDHLHETEDTTDNRHKFYKIQYLKGNNLEPSIIKVIENIEDESVAYELETAEILKFGRVGFEEGGKLTNVCLGSRPPSWKGRIKSKEHRENLSKSHRGKIISDSTRKKNSDITKERILNGEFGHNIPHTEEAKIKMSKTTKSLEYHWYNDGIKSVKFNKNDMIPENFTLGRLVGKRGKYNKDKKDDN